MLDDTVGSFFRYGTLQRSGGLFRTSTARSFRHLVEKIWSAPARGGGRASYYLHLALCLALLSILLRYPGMPRGLLVLTSPKRQ